MKHIRTLVIFAVFMVTSFANAIDIDRTDCELSMQQIMENQDSCVKEISGNKIYLKTDHIFISEKGIYVILNEAGDYAFIPEVCTDETGCFIQVDLKSRVSRGAADNYKRTCLGCGWKYFIYAMCEFR
jgi:hypothetical protein